MNRVKNATANRIQAISQLMQQAGGRTLSCIFHAKTYLCPANGDHSRLQETNHSRQSIRYRVKMYRKPDARAKVISERVNLSAKKPHFLSERVSLLGFDLIDAVRKAAARDFAPSHVVRKAAADRFYPFARHPQARRTRIHAFTLRVKGQTRAISYFHTSCENLFPCDFYKIHKNITH